MNKAIRYSFIFFGLLLIIIGTYLSLIYNHVFALGIKSGLIVSVFNIGIFAIGVLIAAPGLTKNPENFVFRFLTLTTMQLLGALAVMAAVIFVKFPEAKHLCFHLITVFCTLLMVQSVLLIRFLNH